MAEITTKKDLVTVGKEPKQAMALGLQPGSVTLLVENDLVSHFVHMSPQEAVQTGVAMIQLAGQAQALAQQNMPENKRNGLPPNFMKRG